MKKINKIKIASLPFTNKAIIDVFKNNQLVKGDHLNIFEIGLSNQFGFQNVNLTSSGFAALFLALKSLKKVNARVVVPSISTCQAITNAVLANGFEVVFCELDQVNLSLCDKYLSKLFKEKPFDVIIAPSHFGIPAPIEDYKKYGVPVIEDACQAFYTRTNIKSSADIMVLSFYPTKQFNCIEGGAILHNSLEKSINIEDIKYYENQSTFDNITRYNLRMLNLHAAFGCLLMEKIDKERDKLIKSRDIYLKGISDKSLLLIKQSEIGIVPWRFLIKSQNSDLFKKLKLSNIQSDQEMSRLHVANIQMGNKEWFNDYQSIPYYGSITNSDQTRVIKTINEWN